MSQQPANHLLLLLALLPTLAAAELRVAGLDEELERNVRAYASIATEACDAEERVIRRRFRTLEAETRKALEPFGYYSFPGAERELLAGIARC